MKWPLLGGRHLPDQHRDRHPGGGTAGDTKRYQCWYRTTQNPPCGLGYSDFNLSNGLEVVWQP